MYNTFQSFVRLQVMIVLCGLACAGLSAAEVHNQGEWRQVIAQLARPSPDPEMVVGRARRRLAMNLETLERSLPQVGAEASPQFGDELPLPRLKAELARTSPDCAVLKEIEAQFRRLPTSGESPAGGTVGRQLRELLTACEYAAADSPEMIWHARLAELAGCLERLESESSPADSQRAGVLLAWAAALSDDAGDFARSARAQFCRTNALGQVSGRLVNALLEQQVQERHFVTEMILGARTSGPAFSTGHVSFGVIPSPQHAVLSIQLRGGSSCPANVAERGRISVASSAFTSIRAWKQVQISDLGLSLTPATARCNSRVQIVDINAPTRLVERIAWRRAVKLLPQAETAAARSAQFHASAKLDERADTALGGVNELFVEKIRAPLIRRNALPSQWQFWTDAHHLRVSLSQHNEIQLAAAAPSPTIPAQYDLALGAEESMIQNFCESMLGGATIRDESWLELMQLLTGSPPRPLWVHDRAPRWSVTLAAERPVVAQFTEDRLGLTLRLTGITRGNERLELPVEIHAWFVPRTTEDGPALVRTGEVDVRMAALDSNEQEAQLRAFLARKFGAVFPPELYFNGLVPPAGGSLGRLRRLEPVEFRSANHWLLLGYQLAEEAADR
jgi:hypothetical protein